MKLILLLLLFFSTALFSQSVKFGFGGGYAYVDNNTFYSSEVAQNSLPPSLGLKHCYTINTKMKYQNSKFPVNLTWELIYISAPNTFEYLGYSSQIQSGPGIIKLSASQKVYSLGVGIESQIIKSKVNTYFLLGILTSYFGKTEIKRNPEPEKIFKNSEPVIYDVFRIGINAGLGMEYPFTPKTSIDISVKYNFMNIGGESNFSENELEENFNNISFTIFLFYKL